MVRFFETKMALHSPSLFFHLVEFVNCLRIVPAVEFLRARFLERWLSLTLASHAGVFRGARISSLLWGGKKYELP